MPPIVFCLDPEVPALTGRRIGILGGTFDPVHIGHLLAAVHARHACKLDEMLLVVAPNPWQKVDSRTLAPAELRLAAVSAAVEGIKGLEASRIELDRGGLTYTIDTLEQLRDAEPDARLFLVVGTDVAARLAHWREPERVASLADLVVVGRHGTPRPTLESHWRAHHVEMPMVDVSSSDIRARFHDGRPLDFLIPRPALEILVADGHYAMRY